MTTTTETTKKKFWTKRTAIIMTIVALSATGTAVACGGQGKHMSPKMMERMVLGMVEDTMDEVDATDAQRAAFDAAAKNILGEGMALKQSHKSQHKEIQQLLKASTPDREAIKAQVNTHIDAFETFAHFAVDQFLDAFETLDGEQRRLLLEKLEKHGEKH